MRFNRDLGQRVLFTEEQSNSFSFAPRFGHSIPPRAVHIGSTRPLLRAFVEKSFPGGVLLLGFSRSVLRTVEFFVSFRLISFAIFVPSVVLRCFHPRVSRSCVRSARFSVALSSRTQSVRNDPYARATNGRQIYN